MKKLFLLFIFLTSINFIYSQTWVEQTSGVVVSLNSVSVINENNAWVCGASGTVLRTINGGTNWSSVGGGIFASLSLNNIFGIDSLTALVTGANGTGAFVFRTSNGGSSWSPVFFQSGGFINTIAFGNESAGFMVGNPVGGRWSLWGSITGGTFWDSTNFRLPQNGSETGFSNSFGFDAASQSVWFGTNNTRIYRTTNLILWTAQTTTGQINSSALWISGSNGMTGGSGMLFTNNLGTTWNPTIAPLPGSAAIVGITGVSPFWWVVRQAQQVYFTSENGIQWGTQYSAPAGNYNHLSMCRNGIPVIYGVRSNGGISKLTGILTGVTPVSNEIPEKFSLGQNYPNPFNPRTVIRCMLPVAGMVTLKVFDELGREIETLANEDLKAGTYEVDFDGSKYSSGVYYYKLMVNGESSIEYQETKKMVLIK